MTLELQNLILEMIARGETLQTTLCDDHDRNSFEEIMNERPD